MEGRGPVRRGPARPAAAVVNVLGGLLKHLAYVEDFLFGVVLGGNSPAHPWSEVVRFVLTHMIEKYGRRCGHADLLREAIDGELGE